MWRNILYYGVLVFVQKTEKKVYVRLRGRRFSVETQYFNTHQLLEQLLL